LAIVCERFTTSKLSAFDDLQNISTFGFRGEALASISQVAHVTITTMRKGDMFGYKAMFKDGKMVSADGVAASEPQPCASTPGTQFMVDDLFYNYPLRKSAMSPSEEYARIYDVVTRYAFHFAGVAFNLKKLGENKADVSTKRSNTQKDNIRELLGTAIARDLIPLELDVGTQDAIAANTRPVDELCFSLRGYVSGPTANPKKNIFVLFVNDRLVNMAPLKKFLESQYATVMAKSASFIYLSIRIHPTKVDVNMHPNKQEVGIVDQQAVISKIGEYFVEEIDKAGTQQRFRENKATPISDGLVAHKTQAATHFASTASVAATIVRSDAREGSMNSYLGPRRSLSPGLNSSSFGTSADEPVPSDECFGPKSAMTSARTSLEPSEAPSTLRRESVPVASYSSSFLPSSALDLGATAIGNGNLKKRSRESIESTPLASTERTLIQRTPLKPSERQSRLLTSVEQLLQEMVQQSLEPITRVLRDATVVGCLSSRKLLVQAGNTLYLLDMTAFSRELFYQECLHKFGELRVFELEEPASISELVLLALEACTTLCPRLSGSHDLIAAGASQRLVEKRELLEQYFGVVISKSGQLVALPEIVEGYLPTLDGLPAFCYNLHAKLSWLDEMETFDQIARELAVLYAIPLEEEPEDLRVGPGSPVELVSSGAAWAVEHQILPALKRRFHPPQSLQQTQAIVNVVSTDKLFKIFERC